MFFITTSTAFADGALPRLAAAGWLGTGGGADGAGLASVDGGSGEAWGLDAAVWAAASTRLGAVDPASLAVAGSAAAGWTATVAGTEASRPVCDAAAVGGANGPPAGAGVA